MFCGCPIVVGEKYQRSTEVYDGELYDWRCHEDCALVADLLNMYDSCDEGLGEDDFQDNISEYLYANYTDKELDDIPESIRAMSRIERVRKILEDYDKPFIKIPRLKGLLQEYNNRERWRNGLSAYEAKRRDEIKKELEELEKDNVSD